MAKRRVSSVSRVQEEATQAHVRRVPLIRKLEDHFGKTVVALQSSFHFANGIIGDDDATMLEEFLLSTEIRNGLLLFLNSPGGSGVAAERIIRVCRKYSRTGFEVLVPRMAKSAATIICCGAIKIWMGETSELGPVDPQVAWAGERLAVHNILKGYEGILARAAKGLASPELYSELIRHYDPGRLEQLRQDVRLGEELTIDLLSSGMMKGLARREVRRRARVFLDPAFTLVHERPIYREEAERAGMAIGRVNIADPIWPVVWELQQRYDHILQANFGRVIESAALSCAADGQPFDAEEDSEETTAAYAIPGRRFGA
jgi:hypothetical protein